MTASKCRMSKGRTKKSREKRTSVVGWSKYGLVALTQCGEEGLTLCGAVNCNGDCSEGCQVVIFKSFYQSLDVSWILLRGDEGDESGEESGGGCETHDSRRVKNE